MKSSLCILETIRPLQIILDSIMASKMKKILTLKRSLFNPKDDFHPKKSMVSQRNQTLWGLICNEKQCTKVQHFIVKKFSSSLLTESINIVSTS